MAQNKMSPMMEHYCKTKEEYKDCVLFYRLGDFYEMFFEDAVEISKELELTLTGKECGMEERAPMCGIPFHAADTYIRKLVDNGHKVAICEQVEDPKDAKGLVERKVIRIVTPGTVTSQETLEEEKNNYLMCISCSGTSFGVALSDISTGVFLTTFVNSFSEVRDEISGFSPSEIIYQKTMEYLFDPEMEAFTERSGITVSAAPDYYFDKAQAEMKLLGHFRVASAEALGLKDLDDPIIASGALLTYISETQMTAVDQISSLKLYFRNDYMIIDSATRRNLELTETMRDKKKQGSLLWVLDKTKTAMGARLLRSWVKQPLLKKPLIEMRLDAVEELSGNLISRDEMREYMSSIYDLERLITRISLKTVNARDLLSFKTSLRYLPDIKNILKEFSCEVLTGIQRDLDPLSDIYELIEKAISEDAPLTIKEGGIFKDGYMDEIDRLKYTKANEKSLLAALEEKERESTGIKTLRIKFNKVFGYYFEVTNSFKDMVPDYFIRKQTLVNAERYTTEELNNLAGNIIGSEDKLYGLEYQEFVSLRERLAKEIERVQKTAGLISMLDALTSLSYVATKNSFARPSINEEGRIDIKGGRHPVIEQMIPSGTFIPNDTYLDMESSRISIITGPNMSGKSTYMRQTAIICLMAQIGSFVPADSADICLSDRIFTRVGASDDLASGQSTFMVEMSEVANILRNSTSNSLIILDEIGRGTSTFDGLAIAWAVAEYIADMHLCGAKTLFATHYHELTDLEGRMPSVKNYSIAIRQDADQIVFLRKIVPGGSSSSYGIDVAKLAGVPCEVIDRAKEIAAILEKEDLTGNTKSITGGNMSERAADKNTSMEQLTLFGTPEELNIAAELRDLDLNNMTPMKALNYLQQLKDRLR